MIAPQFWRQSIGKPRKKDYRNVTVPIAGSNAATPVVTCMRPVYTAENFPHGNPRT